MTSSHAAKRYARALFSLSQEKEVLVAVTEDLESLRKLLDESDDFQAFLDHPLIPPTQRRAAINALFQGRVTALTLGFMLFLEEKRRLDIFRQIADAFETTVNRHRARVNVAITAAAPLEEDQVAAICAQLRVRTGMDVQAEVQVNPDLIGGFRIKIEDEIIDFSLMTQLQNLKQKLITA